MSHTPGPWTKDGSRVKEQHRGVICIAPSPPHGGVFERQENLVLMAAAPELLEALKGMIQLIQNGVLVRDISMDHEAGFAVHQLPLLMTLKKSQSAIAKAEGGTDDAA